VKLFIFPHRFLLVYTLFICVADLQSCSHLYTFIPVFSVVLSSSSRSLRFLVVCICIYNFTCCWFTHVSFSFIINGDTSAMCQNRPIFQVRIQPIFLFFTIGHLLLVFVIPWNGSQRGAECVEPTHWNVNDALRWRLFGLIALDWFVNHFGEITWNLIGPNSMC
jgi:hypothetical protein